MVSPVSTFCLLSLAFGIGLIKAGVGVGTGVFTSAILSLFANPIIAVPLVAPLMFFADLFTMGLYQGKSHHRLVWALVPPAIVGTFLGGKLLVILTANQGRFLLGSIAIWFVLQQLYHPAQTSHCTQAQRPWVPLFFGFVAGLFSGFAHTGGTVITVYLYLLHLDKEELIATLAHFLLCINIVKIGTYLWLGLLGWPQLFTGVLLTPFLYAGAYLARRLNRRLSNDQFLRLILGATWLSGVLLLIS